MRGFADDTPPPFPELEAALRALAQTLEVELEDLPAKLHDALSSLPLSPELEHDIRALLRTARDAHATPTPPCHLYILDGTQPVRCDDFLQWLEWYRRNASSSIVATIQTAAARVRTLFVGTHNNKYGAPLLFETTVIGGKLDGFARRYATWQQAEEGHSWAVDAST